MNTIRRKHIVIGLAVTFILFLFCRNGDEDYSYDQTGTQAQGAFQSHTSFRSSDIEQAYSSTGSYTPSNHTRHEILQTKVKGYREETYWGEQHPTYEKARDMSDYEFDRYIDEVGINDADVYWGESY